MGFRPAVFRLARQKSIHGRVWNTSDGLHIHVSGDRKTASSFSNLLKKNIPHRAIITDYKMVEIPFIDYRNFSIIKSQSFEDALLMIPPDVNLCSDCRQDLKDGQNRRFRYAFTTCTQCGPRYSILKTLPYDRENTTMDIFTLCSVCQTEYDDPENRRYYSQTNSCPICAVKLQYFRSGTLQTYSEPEKTIAKVVEDLQTGGIIALKGIGGYLIMADATHGGAIRKIRNLKSRLNKPLALMYPALEILSGDVHLSQAQIQSLIGDESPIVLLPLKKNTMSFCPWELIAPGLDQIGVMLPYAPFLNLISQTFGGPLIATSGNRKGEPIIFNDHEAKEIFQPVINGILSNNREIVTPQDDSVVSFTHKHSKRIFIRRSRGYAPLFKDPVRFGFGETILALGAELKGAFAVNYRGITHISQYLGDLEYFPTQENFKKVLTHTFNLLSANPDRILVDAHPGYFVTRLGTEMARERKIPLNFVQHHCAHFAAILGEHDLLETGKKVLGVVWDGTGYGDDGCIWGGEFFLFEGKTISRIVHLDYYPHIAGDKMPKEPRLSAFALGHVIPDCEPILKIKFTEEEWRIYDRLGTKNDLYTSSMGRVFDAVSSLLGLADLNTYEGEAAIYLEKEARTYYDRITSNLRAYPFTVQNGSVDIKPMVSGIMEDITSEKEIGFISVRFHLTLVEWVEHIAEQSGAEIIAFSGGVFQNAFLIDRMIDRLSGKYQLCFHEQLSPNDESVCYGQLAYFYIKKNLHSD